jgi:hypothetical protein
MTEEDLKEEFSHHGTIRDVQFHRGHPGEMVKKSRIATLRCADIPSARKISAAIDQTSLFGNILTAKLDLDGDFLFLGFPFFFSIFFNFYFPFGDNIFRFCP